MLNNGGAWYPGAGVSEMPSPHGLGSDLNGFLYIAETRDGDIRKLTCDGELKPETEFVIPKTGAQFFNITSIGITLYTNGGDSYDVCTGNLINSICFNGPALNPALWGLWYDDNTGYFYTAAFENVSGAGVVYRYRPEDYGSGVCIDPFIAPGTTATPAVGDNATPNNANILGITTDNLGNIYIAYGGYQLPGGVLKYDANGNFIAISIIDTVEDGVGYWGNFGIVYSETCDCIYTSTLSSIEDCVALFDTDLNYLGAAVPPTGDTGQNQDPFSIAKAIAIAKECCPTEPIQNITQSYCVDEPNAQVFIQDVYNCEGVVCEGTIFTPSNLDASISYDDCSQSITLSGVSGCGTFTKTSDGMGSTAQCPAFFIELNICFYRNEPCSTPDEFTFQKRRP